MEVLGMVTIAINNIDLYNLLRTKLGDSEAKNLIDFVEASVDNGFEKKKDVLATKEDVRVLEVKLAETKADIIKWMFIFWIGQVATVIAIMKLL